MEETKEEAYVTPPEMIEKHVKKELLQKYKEEAAKLSILQTAAELLKVSLLRKALRQRLVDYLRTQELLYQQEEGRLRRKLNYYASELNDMLLIAWARKYKEN